jgi:DNA-binding XRE family transcriptional regulator
MKLKAHKWRVGKELERDFVTSIVEISRHALEAKENSETYQESW